MAFTSAVLGCSNSSRKWKWKVKMCEIHHARRGNEIYACDPSFR